MYIDQLQKYKKLNSELKVQQNLGTNSKSDYMVNELR